MSTRAAITSSAARPAPSTTSEVVRNGDCSVCARPFADQLWPELIEMIRSRTVATPISKPPMNTNGATAATTSIALLRDLRFGPPAPVVALDRPANRPPSTVPTHPPAADIEVHGCARTTQYTHAGP